MSMVGIYKITNPKGKIYIGQSIHIEKRWIQYSKLISNKKCIGTKLYNSLSKYEYQNHIFEIIEECDRSKLNEREIYWIKYFNAIELGLNISKGGVINISNESREISRLKRLKPIYQLDLNGSILKEWNSASEATNYFNSPKGDTIGRCCRGEISTAFGFRWVFIKHPSKIKPFLPLNKSVIQYDFEMNIINEFSSIKEASEFTKINRSTLTSYLYNRMKNKEHIWKFK